MQKDGTVRVEVCGDKIRIIVRCSSMQAAFKEAGFFMALGDAEQLAETLVMAVRRAEATAGE